MKIAAVSDIHGPLYIDEFKDSLSKAGDVECFLFAGDITLRNNQSWYQKIVKLVDKKIFAVFGNEEWARDKFKSKLPNVTFIEEDSVEFHKIKIVGSTGVLDQPTDWQSKNIPGIEKIYNARIKRLETLLDKNSILLLHYAPTYLTLIGEPPSVFPKLGSERLEKVILEKRPRLVIHGHSHNGIPKTKLGSIDIYNVAMPLNKSITVIEL